MQNKENSKRKSKMDDGQFDDIIKRKIGEYEEPGFDPAALASLHHQLGLANAWPWYKRFRTELITGSAMVFCTLIILLSQWYRSNQNSITLYMQRQEILKLNDEIKHLKNNPPDTVRIIEIREQTSPLYTSLLYRIIKLESEVMQAERFVMDSEMLKERIAALMDSLEKGGLLITERNAEPVKESLFRLEPRKIHRESSRAPTRKNILSNSSASQPVSVKTLRDMEKHYQKGVGIRLGPTIEISEGLYSRGEGPFNFGVGVLADFILSPALSLETGVKHMKRYYEIDDPKILETVPLPGVDESIGSLTKAEMEKWMYEIPLTLKYRYPISSITRALVGVGYSPQIYSRQVFEYDYQFNNGDFSLNSKYQENKFSFYPGTVNLSIGLSSQLKNKKIFETSVYYQQALTEMGIEKVKAQFFGIRGVYWFTIR